MGDCFKSSGICILLLIEFSFQMENTCAFIFKKSKEEAVKIPRPKVRHQFKKESKMENLWDQQKKRIQRVVDMPLMIQQSGSHLTLPLIRFNMQAKKANK